MTGIPVDRARLWVSVDQAGRVTAVTGIAVASPGAFDQAAREQLVGNPSRPADKDPLSVNSGALLDLRQASPN